MPAKQPFTQLCQVLARSNLYTGRADLHMHSTFSDGSYTPDQLVQLARRSGLAAIALTDHDTLQGFTDTRRAAAGAALEVISGVEITCEFHQRELHLLAYFVDPEDSHLNLNLARIRQQRETRFFAMIERLKQLGVSVDNILPGTQPISLGRRYLAELLVQQGHAGSVREAFQRWLNDRGVAHIPNYRLAVADAISCVHQAGGVASWAHPVYDGSGSTAHAGLTALSELTEMGLDAVEVEYPDVPRSHRRQWRQWAEQLNLVVTGGSDCHGPGRRTIGCCSISDSELDALRRRSQKYSTSLSSPQTQV